MEVLFAQERAQFQHVLDLIKSPGVTPETIVEAFRGYRPVCETVVLAAFPNTLAVEEQQWQLHGEGRKYFHSALKKLRRAQPPAVVETRKMTKEYLRFLKDSQSAYRDHIYTVSTAYGGIPELEAIAHKFKGDNAGESQQQPLRTEYALPALETCHRTLVYLGDLSRYRASEALDQNPDFGPAIGYYDLAATILPKSGVGHHQQAVVARERDHHLLTVYHLYRSMAVEVPFVLAPGNLKLAFSKINAAHEKNTLIQKGPPNDPDRPLRALTGFFVRMHSMCYKGEDFPAHAELEREILSLLTIVVKQCSSGHTIMRMAIMNIAAQHMAIKRLQEESSSPQHSKSVYLLLQFNVRTLTTLLRIYYDDLHSKVAGLENHDVELATKLTPIARLLLPVLRVYHDWLNNNETLTLLVGLIVEPSVGGYIHEFWNAYARTIDLVAQAFPVWDLDDLPELVYMLEEDVNTLGFLPLENERTVKTWYYKQNGARKVLFSDFGVTRLTEDEEMLRRIDRMLNDGTDVAMALKADHADPPLKLLRTRFYNGNEADIEELVVRPVEYVPETVAPPKSRKPVSYAAAAAAANATARARQARPTPAPRPAPQQAAHPATAQVPSGDAQAAQLNRMVDDLVDDDEDNNPVTPPQQPASNPAVVQNGELPHILQDSVHDLAGTTPHTYQGKDAMAMSTPNISRSPYAARPGSKAGYSDRTQGMSRTWGHAQQSPYSSFPPGLPVGTLGSPDMAVGGGHSRVNSAGSVRSRTSLNAVDRWAAADKSPRTLPEASQPIYNHQSSLDQIGMTSPLLFGAGGGLWSTNPQPGYRNVSPPNGQGG